MILILCLWQSRGVHVVWHCWVPSCSSCMGSEPVTAGPSFPFTLTFAFLSWSFFRKHVLDVHFSSVSSSFEGSWVTSRLNMLLYLFPGSCLCLTSRVPERKATWAKEKMFSSFLRANHHHCSFLEVFLHSRFKLCLLNNWFSIFFPAF